MMGHKNIALHATSLTALTPAARNTGAADGVTIDRQGFEAVALHCAMGALGSGTCVVKLQHGDASDGSDKADFGTTSPTTASLAAADKTTVITVDLSQAKRYITCVATAASATGQILGIVAQLYATSRSLQAHQANATDHQDFDGFFIAS